MTDFCNLIVQEEKILNDWKKVRWGMFIKGKGMHNDVDGMNALGVIEKKCSLTWVNPHFVGSCYIAFNCTFVNIL